jgi:hypothetical protein
MPVNTAFGSGMKPIFGLRLCTISLRIGPDQPADRGLHNFALVSSGWTEQCEIEQWVCIRYQRAPQGQSNKARLQ